MRISSIFTGTTLGFMVLFASALITAPASTVHAQAFPSFNCDAPGANLQTKIDGAPYGATIFFGGNCDDGPYFINAGQNLHLRGFSSGGTLSAPGGGDCVVCVRFAHVKFTRLNIDATGADAGISVEGGTAEIFDINIDATGAFAGIRVFGGTVNIADTNINADGAFAVINIEGGEARIGPGTTIDATGAQNGIAVLGGTVNIFQTVIQYSVGVGINVGSSSHANISDSEISYNPEGINVSQSSSIAVSASDIKSNTFFGITLAQSSSGTIDDSMIDGNGQGINVESNSSLRINSNIISNNTFGLHISLNGYVDTFNPNTFQNNTAGVDVLCDTISTFRASATQIAIPGPGTTGISDDCLVIVAGIVGDPIF